MVLIFKQRLRRTLLLSLAICLSHITYSQVECGTEDYRSDELIEFQKMNTLPVGLRADDPLYVNTVIHIVGKDDGTAYTNIDVLFQQACETNEVYNRFGVVFYISQINFINNTRYNDHDHPNGLEMMRRYKVANAVNLFFVSNPNGYCGYYVRGVDCIAIGNNCLRSGAYTWAHELGHYFSLPHTFLGWEGVDYNPNEPTPNILNGRQTERLDGSNCRQAGDGFCDTPPDYLSSRWACDKDSMSILKLKDFNGEEFQAQGNLIMSYSQAGCRGIFSEEQQNAMKYNIITTRSLDISEPDFPRLGDWKITGISPAMDEEVYYDKVTFSWEPVDGAIGYMIEYTALKNFNTLYKKAFVTESFYQPDTIYPTWTNIIWRVKPYGHRSNCVPEFKDTFQFTTMVTARKDISLKNNAVIYPNPIVSSQMLYVDSKTGYTQPLHIKIYDMTGKLVRSVKRDVLDGNTVSLHVQSLKPGVHILQINDGQTRSTHKIIVIE